MNVLNKSTFIKTINAHLSEQNYVSLKEMIQHVDAFLLASVFQELNTKQLVITFRLLAKNKALDVFEMMDASGQKNLIEALTEEASLDFFRSLEPDDQMALLDELPAAVAKRLIAQISPEERDKVTTLMGFPKGTVGHVMTPNFVRLDKTMTVKDALKHLKEKVATTEMLYHLYITSPARQLEGSLTLADLILHNENTLLQDIMNNDIVFTKANEKDEVVARLLQDTDLYAVPVVDSEKRILGIFTVDDAIDVLEEESIEQALSKAGFADSYKETSRSKILTQGNLWQVWRVRLPYLMLALLGGLLAGAAIEQFEDALEAIAALAFFIPVIMDMGGNVGTQSSTIFTRALIFGHIDFKRFTRQWLREILIGFTMGLLAATVAGLIVLVWQNNARIALTVGLSLVGTITIASAIGFLVPAALSRLGFDQAAGSDPFITTIKDISGLLIYFFLATIILGI